MYFLLGASFYVTKTPRSEFLPTPIRMSLNDFVCPIQIKVRFTDGTLDLRVLSLLELTKRLKKVS